ncbi:unnamed protein product [Litomosoides sigmodontis]|uniref:Uncharacterized protein n=1 Tax=Litomosoides sigmodontis TaxID=42156 RepID=A0A3P6S760_LITSI|nr:unnamed protein product [Litomosoides sigmodontis]
MLPIWADAYSDDHDEEEMLCSVKENFSSLCSPNNDDIRVKVVTQIRKLTNFLERGVIHGAICFLTGTGTVLGAIEQISKKAERSINETVDHLTGTDRTARNEESFLLPYFEDTANASLWRNDGKMQEASSDEIRRTSRYPSPALALAKEERVKDADESNC